jgi:hypothetical protein
MNFQLPFKFAGQSERAPMMTHARQPKIMEYDQPLIWVTLLLMLLGMVMVYSASISLPDSPKFAYLKDRNAYFLLRQAMFIAISCVAALFVFRIRIETWQRAAPMFCPRACPIWCWKIRAASLALPIATGSNPGPPIASPPKTPSTWHLLQRARAWDACC